MSSFRKNTIHRLIAFWIMGDKMGFFVCFVSVVGLIVCFTCGAVLAHIWGVSPNKKHSDRMEEVKPTQAETDNQEQWLRMMNYTGRNNE